MIVNKSPATSFTPIVGISDAGDQQGPLIDLSEQGAVVDDIPHAVVDLLEADMLVAQALLRNG